MRGTLLGLICAAALGCGSHKGPSGPDDATAVLTIDPPSSELMITNGVAGSESFTATLTYTDGTTKDVTATTVFAIDPIFGSFSGPALTAKGAGKTTVLAMYVDKMASAEVIVRLKDVRVDPGVPAGAPGWFSGPEDPTRAPKIVYPATGVIMPRNVGDFEVHWTDSAGNDVFEVSLVTEFADVRAYVLGGNGSVTGGSWTAFLADEWTAAVGAETAVQFQVRGTLSTNPVSVGSAPPQLVKLSNEEMLGGLYYWASTSTTGVAGIFRHDMSMPGQPAQQFMTTAQTSGRCVACHVLSHDGHEMLVTYDGGDHMATTVDVASSTAQPASNYWNFATFTPDGTQFLSVHQGQLVVRRYSDQSVLSTMTASGWVSHPDLSPDGTKLVYVHPNANSGISDWSFDGGSIFVRTFDQATGTFGPEQQLVADGQNNFYPSFSPDGQWILFNKAPLGASSYNNSNATLWVVKADNSAPAVQLATANSAAGLTDSWGRWAPFAQTFGANQEKMYWVTVSSKRDFGVRLVGVNRPQIWMTPFFPDRAASAQDPSAQAFRLPFQDIESNNHIAQWTEQVVVTQ
jgi:hypothetical protein